MSTPADVIAKEMRNEAEARLNQYKAERERLLLAADRIKELDALIAYLEDDSQPSIPIAKRPVPVKEPVAVAEPIAAETITPTPTPIRTR